MAALAAAVSAPITALIPQLDAGMVAAFVEAWRRPPSLEEREGLSQVSSLAGWRSNQFTRVLLVGVITGVGGVVGALIGAALLLARL